MAFDFPLLQLVDRPEPDATVRFDFNDANAYADADSFTIGAPSMLGDPGGVGSGYGFRSVSFTFAIRESEATALRRQSLLARELLRDENWLYFRLSPTAPSRWFKLWRSSPGEASLAQVYRERDPQEWRIAVSLVAEPFAVGEVITIPLTVGNNPATGGLTATLPDIVGDAPAPLTVEIQPGSTTYAQPLLSVASVDALTWPGGTVWQAETWTMGALTAVTAVTDASGGSAARVSVPAFGTTDARRVTGNVTVPYAGRWRLFVRTMLKGNWTAYSVDTVATITGSGAACAEPVVTTMLANAATAGSARMVELGTYVFPKGNMPSSKPYTLAASGVGINAAVTSGGVYLPTLDFDYIVAIPIDLPLDQVQPPRTLAFTRQSATAGDATLRLDAEAEAVQEIRSGAYGAASPEVPAGAFPSAVPGATNVLHFMPRRGSATTDGYYRDSLSDTTTLTLTYRPRVLYFGLG